MLSPGRPPFFPGSCLALHATLFFFSSAIWGMFPGRCIVLSLSLCTTLQLAPWTRGEPRLAVSVRPEGHRQYHYTTAPAALHASLRSRITGSNKNTTRPGHGPPRKPQAPSGQKPRDMGQKTKKPTKGNPKSNGQALASGFLPREIDAALACCLSILHSRVFKEIWRRLSRSPKKRCLLLRRQRLLQLRKVQAFGQRLSTAFLLRRSAQVAWSPPRNLLRKLLRNLLLLQWYLLLLLRWMRWPGGCSTG